MSSDEKAKWQAKADAAKETYKGVLAEYENNKPAEEETKKPKAKAAKKVDVKKKKKKQPEPEPPSSSEDDDDDSDDSDDSDSDSDSDWALSGERNWKKTGWSCMFDVQLKPPL